MEHKEWIGWVDDEIGLSIPSARFGEPFGWEELAKEI